MAKRADECRSTLRHHRSYIEAMPESGIKIVSGTPGTGAAIENGDSVCVRYEVQFDSGDYIAMDLETTFTVGVRELVAGFSNAVEGMRAGGARKFRASPHLCWSDPELERIPRNMVCVFEIKNVELLA